MTDPIQHLRKLMAGASFEGPLIPQLYHFGEVADIVDHDGQMVVGDPNGHNAACGGADAALIVAAINALPALLAVAEAARAYMGHKCPNGDLASIVNWQQEMDKRFMALIDAIAKLDEVKAS